MGGPAGDQVGLVGAVDADDAAPGPAGEAGVGAGAKRLGPVGPARVRDRDPLADPEAACRRGGARLPDSDRGPPYSPAGVVEGGAEVPAVHDQASPNEMQGAKRGIRDPSRPPVRTHRDANLQPGALIGIGEGAQDEVDLWEPVLGEIAQPRDPPRGQRRQPPDRRRVLRVRPGGERLLVRQAHASSQLRLRLRARRCRHGERHDQHAGTKPEAGPNATRAHSDSARLSP